MPNRVTNVWAQTLRMALYGLREQESIEVLIDCGGGEDTSFDLCLELWWRWKKRNRKPRPPPYKTTGDRGLKTTTTVLGEARSIGLSYAVCATQRLAMPGVTFAAHGAFDRAGARHESGVYLQDHYTADWLARFTKRSYEDWLAYIDDGGVHEFGVAEALKWGVIDEVLEGV